MDTDLTTWLLSAVAFTAATSATPGPNNAMVAASGATFGFARTVPHMLGVALGFPLMLVALAAGAGGFLRAMPVLHEVLKWLGAAYLLYLAIRIARARPADGAGTTRSAPLSFVGAALFQWVNPKAWFMAVSAIGTYTPGPNVAAQAALLGGVFAVVALPSIAFWTLTGVGAARLLRTDAGLRAFNMTMAALLVLSLVPVLLDWH